MSEMSISSQGGAALRVKGLRKSFGGLTAVDGISVEFVSGTVTAIIGPNGAGKTTFFNLVTGGLKADAGEIWLEGERVVDVNPRRLARLGVARAFQIAQVFPDLTVRQTIEAVLTARERRHLSLFSSFPNRDTAAKADEMLNWLELADDADIEARNLPHGARKRLDLAIAVAQAPKVLLLDEPAAGLGHDDRARISKLIRELTRQHGTTVVLVEHDMDLIFDLAERIVVLNFGRKLAEGTPSEIRENREVVDAYLGEEG